MVLAIRCRVQFGAPQGYCDFGGKTPNHPYFGATIGRVANRISKGTFELGESCADESYTGLAWGRVGTMFECVWSLTAPLCDL